MKKLLPLALTLGVLALPANAQTYAIKWFKIAGGGGTSTNGTYQISGTTGQPDASGAMAGGSFSLTGGFWSIISVVPSAGVPNLVIAPYGPNSVQILWPNTGSYTLEQNNNLVTPSGWTASGYLVTTVNGTNQITLTPPNGNLFFRLSSP